MSFWARAAVAAPGPAGGAAVGTGAMAACLILALVNLLNYYDRMLVVVVSQPLREAFSLTDTQYGLLTGPAFVIVYAVSSLVFGWLADRRSRKTVIAVALAAWSIMTALCGLARDFPMLALARAGVGVGEGGSNPAGMSLLSDHFPPAKRPMALGLFAAGGMVGLFLSFVVGSWIGANFGWRAVFLVAGIPGILLSLAVILWVKEPARGRFESAPPRRLSYASSLKLLAGNRAYIWLCIAASLGVFSSLGMMIWLPQFFIRTHGLGLQQVGLFFGPAAALGLLAGMIAGSWAGNRLSARSLHRPIVLCVVANLLLPPLYLMVLWTSSLPLALAGTFVAMALSVLYAPAFQASMQNVCDPDVRATGAAVSNVLNGVVGQGLLPLFVGMMSDALIAPAGSEALRWALSIATVFILASGLLFIKALGETRRHFSSEG
ncbi:spinster family MFS transporter [Sphingosinicella terrae]|uniref:spinster family MFS transporter n=1 Tax=Sphingosinicella terrae TaxID=2172047 RepID=UPI000E0D63F7|nr:MFS transporter [Sphingosinicella terrae]